MLEMMINRIPFHPCKIELVSGKNASNLSFVNLRIPNPIPDAPNVRLFTLTWVPNGHIHGEMAGQIFLGAFGPWWLQVALRHW